MTPEDTSSDDRRGGRSSLITKIFFLPMLVIMVVAVSILVFVMVMQQSGWHVPMIGATGVIAKIAQPGQKVILYASPSSKAYFNKIGGNYDTLLVPWRHYFDNRNIDIDEINDPDLLNQQSFGVLIVPSALSLSTHEREAILKFRSRGGGVLATWASGTRTSSGEWAGWQFLESLGAKWVGEIPANSDSRHLTLHGESPVSSKLDAGTRIWMGKTTETLLRLKGESVAGHFMNWSRVLEDERRNEGAVIFSETTPDVGRAVVYAFAETSWESRPFVPHQLMDDTLSWLRREPRIVRAAWPNAAQSAQLIEMDTEQDFDNALAFAAMMKNNNIPATFYVLTSVAVQYPDALKALAREFEIAYHGDTHVSFKGQTASTQEQRILNMQADLKSVLSDTTQVTGFRAPTEGYDATTELLLQKHGLRHHAADPSRLEGRLPSVVKMEGVKPEQSLIVLVRTQRDDINLGLENHHVAETAKALIDDFDFSMTTGSLGFSSMHSQNFGEDSILRQAMPVFLAHLQKRREHILLASSGQMTQWWHDRDRVTLSSGVTGKRLDFNLTVKGDQPVSGMTLMIMLPAKGRSPTVSATKIDMTVPTVRQLDDYRAALVFDRLEPGNYSFQATFAN